MKRSDRANALKKLLPIVTVTAPEQQSSARGRLFAEPGTMRVKVQLPAGSRPHGNVSVELRSEPKTSEGPVRGEALADPDNEPPKEKVPSSGHEEDFVPAKVEQRPGLNEVGEKQRNVIFNKEIAVEQGYELTVSSVTFYDQVYGKVTFEPNGNEPASIKLNDEIELSPVLNSGKGSKAAEVGLDR